MLHGRSRLCMPQYVLDTQHCRDVVLRTISTISGQEFRNACFDRANRLPMFWTELLKIYTAVIRITQSMTENRYFPVRMCLKSSLSGNNAWDVHGLVILPDLLVFYSYHASGRSMCWKNCTIAWTEGQHPMQVDICTVMNIDSIYSEHQLWQHWWIDYPSTGRWHYQFCSICTRVL